MSKETCLKTVALLSTLQLLIKLNQKNSRHTSRRTAIAQPKLPGNSRFATQKCKRCGNKPHPRDQCPAKQAECYKCKKKGHFSS